MRMRDTLDALAEFSLRAALNPSGGFETARPDNAPAPVAVAHRKHRPG